MSLVIAEVATARPHTDQYVPQGPAPFTAQVRPIHYDLSAIRLPELMAEEEQLAFRSTYGGLPVAARHRLAAITKEVDRRWSCFH